MDKRLHVQDNSAVLSWISRLNIALGTARGLQFLHTIAEKPLIHCDIKSANILLDHNNLPRIGDFGLAREGPVPEQTHLTVSKVHGTRPYLPEEFLRSNKFSTKVDTYSFGVVLFEIGTSLGAISEKRQDKYLKDFVVNFTGELLELKDPRCFGGDQIYSGLMQVGLECVSRRAKDRPEMTEVYKMLEMVIRQNMYR